MKSNLVEKLRPIDKDMENKSININKKVSKVVQSLQEECEKEESTKQKQTFRFTKEQVRWISYLIDNHGDDYQVR